MKTAEAVAAQVVPDFLLEHMPKGWLVSLRYDVAQAIIAFAADANDYYYEHIALNMAKQARAEALEEAAKVAETIYGTQFHDKVEVRTGRKIAANIRAMKEKP